MAKKNREINVFSTSAIDLFASALGVFIVLVMILFPYFGKTSKEPPRPIIATKTENVEELKKALSEIQTFSTTLERAVKDAKSELQEAQSKSKTLEEQLQSREILIAELKSKIPQAAKEDPKPSEDQETLSKALQALQQLQVQKESLQQENSKLKLQVADLPELTSQKQSLEVEKQKLEQQIQKMKQTQGQNEQQQNANFMAIIIQWPTLKHDIDLRVTSPSNKQYDFKSRRHKTNPAEFTLDSRTGPGSEVWQTSELEPGVYKVRYKFYNQYGNPEDARVQGRVFTKLGSVELPERVLKFPTQRDSEFRFSVSADGKVQML